MSQYHANAPLLVPASPEPPPKIPLDAEGKVNMTSFLDDAAHAMGQILIGSGQAVKATTARFLMASVGALCAGSGISVLVDKAVLNWISDYTAELVETDVAFMVELVEWKRDHLVGAIAGSSACVCDDVSTLNSGTKCCSPGHPEKCDRWKTCNVDMLEGGFSCMDLSPLNPKNSLNKDAVLKNKQDLSTVRTFNGILEFMDHFQPKFTILENVENLGKADNPDSNMANILEVDRGLIWPLMGPLRELRAL
jgi:hypothetical protein